MEVFSYKLKLQRWIGGWPTSTFSCTFEAIFISDDAQFKIHLDSLRAAKDSTEFWLEAKTSWTAAESRGVTKLFWIEYNLCSQNFVLEITSEFRKVKFAKKNNC